MIPGAFNFRDVGPLPVRGGRVVTGRAFRSDLLHREDSEVAHRVLDELGVTRVIDLRTAGERERDGSLTAQGGREVLSTPILAEVWSWDDEQGAGDEWFLRDRTIEIFEHRGHHVVEVLTLIAQADGAVVFHCTAGKDRTGVVSASLLGLLGASREVMVADYARSAEALPALADWYRIQEGRTEEPTEAQKTLLARAARPETMDAVVDHVETEYGGFGGWAATHDLAPEVIDALRAVLVVGE